MSIRILHDKVQIAHIDERGEIRNISPNVAVITSRKGTVRSNHLHKLGWHWLYVVTGKMRYLEKRRGEVTECLLWPGERVFTGPGVAHRTEFLEDTVLVSCGPTSNNQEHDHDTVKVEWT